MSDKISKSGSGKSRQSSTSLDQSGLASLPTDPAEFEEVEFCFCEARHGAAYLDRSSTIINEICQAVETLSQDPFRLPRTNQKLGQVVRMRLEGLSYDAIGDIFGCTRQNIDSLLKPLKPLLANDAYRALFDKIIPLQSNDLRVLNMLGTGQSLAQIGAALGITAQTVSNARDRLLNGSLAEATLTELQAGVQIQLAAKEQERLRKREFNQEKIAQFLDLRLNQGLRLNEIGELMQLHPPGVMELMRLAEKSRHFSPEEKRELHRRRYIIPPTPPNLTDPAQTAQRQQNVLELLFADHNIKEIARIVNTSRSTVWRDLKCLEISQDEPTKELIREKREAILYAWKHHRSLRQKK